VDLACEWAGSFPDKESQYLFYALFNHPENFEILHVERVRYGEPDFKTDELEILNAERKSYRQRLILL
jgi:hypothetical protein